MPDIDTLARIAEVEFADIVVSVLRVEHKIRIIFIDNSFMEFVKEKIKE